MSEIPHGTISGYNYHRCRCADCRAAKAAVKRRYSAARRAAQVPCSVEECGKVVAGADPYCSAHKARLAKAGTVGGADTRTNDGVARHYSTAHNRLRLVRGIAAEYVCVDCGRAAEDWSLKKSATQRMAHDGGVRDGLSYSPDPYDYEPRCKRCHAAYDGYGGGGVRDDAAAPGLPAEVRDETEPE